MNNISCRKKNCIMSLLFFVLLMVFGILLLGQTNQLDLINRRIDDINSGRLTCPQACGYDYTIQQGQVCCLYYSLNICTDKKRCAADQLYNFINQYNDAIEKIWIYSFLTFLMLVIFCWIVRRGCKEARRGVAVQEAVYHGVNDSHGINNNLIQSNHDNRRNHSAYQSFAYHDNQSTCCICLEEFKDQKAILLKCGHIFHSKCIRDWAAKQKNCPVCRSSQ